MGDGTNFVVTFGGELLERSVSLLEEGVHLVVLPGPDVPRRERPVTVVANRRPHWEGRKRLHPVLALR